MDGMKLRGEPNLSGDEIQKDLIRLEELKDDEISQGKKNVIFYN
jgi:hypothetical protein